MIDMRRFHECLQNAGVEFFAGVPDTLLNDFCRYVETELPREKHVIAANEGNAIALATGYHLATGTVPVVYMQNSGIGNSVNPLCSLTNKEVYAIPMVLIIGWRGDPAVNDHVHHQKQGDLTPVLMEDMEIPHKILDDNTEKALEYAQWAVDTAKKQSTPTALIVKKGVLAKLVKDPFDSTNETLEMSRENAIEVVIKNVPNDAICVASTGRATRELYALRDLRGEEHDRDFLNIGAMGHASSIAAGMALAHPKRQVVCLDGDSAAIMHMGALTTIGVLGLPNFLHVVLNNGVHESVGCQLSAGFRANLTGIAENAGYRTIGKAVETGRELRDAIEKLLQDDGPAFIDVHIRKGIRSDLPKLRFSHIEAKEKLMLAMKNQGSAKIK